MQSLQELSSNSLLQVERQEILEAACLYQWITEELYFPDYKLFAEWLGAYKWEPYPKEYLYQEIGTALYTLLRKQKKDINSHQLFLISFYASQLQSHSTKVQQQVTKWILDYSNSLTPHS